MPPSAGRRHWSTALCVAGVLLLVAAFFTADALALLWLLEANDQVLMLTLSSGIILAVAGAACLMASARVRPADPRSR